MGRGSFRFGDAHATRTWAPLAPRFSSADQKRSSEVTPGIARAPGTKPGRRLSGKQTDGTADAQEVDVPPHDEQRVRNTHDARITCNGSGCPGSVRHVDGAKGQIRRHTRGNRPALSAIPRSPPGAFEAPPSLVAPPSLLSPVGAGALWLAGVGLTPLRRSTLAEPAERGLGFWLCSRLAGRRQVLAVAPGAAGALLVVLFPARDADHLSIVRLRPCISSLCPGKCGT